MTSSERKWQNNLLLFTVVVNPDSAEGVGHAELNLFTLQICICLLTTELQRHNQSMWPENLPQGVKHKLFFCSFNFSEKI
jgi:hypothetical protein